MKLLHPRSWSLSVKFPLLITAVVAGAAVVIGVAIVAQYRQTFETALEEKALLLARATSATATEAILRQDYWSLYLNLKQTATRASGGGQDTLVLTGMVLDAEGRVLAHLDPRNHPLGLPMSPIDGAERQLLATVLKTRTASVLSGTVGDQGFVEGVVPVQIDSQFLGVVRLRLSKAELEAQTWAAGLTVLGLTLALVALASLLGTLVSARMVRPLKALARGMQSVGRGEFSPLRPIVGGDRDEIGQLLAIFNQMATELEEKKRLEQELALKEKLADLGQIAAEVAHEVNNPLGGMLNCIGTLKKRPDDRELLERYLPLLEKGLNRIRTTVQTLLAGVRHEAPPSPCALACLSDVRELVTAEARDRNVTLAWDSRLADDAQVHCSCPQVQQMLLNLAKNGIQAMPQGGTLTVRSFKDRGALVLEVEDDGTGIRDQEQTHLFDQFCSSRRGGTGLGLWVTHQLADKMGGSIDVASALGSGSVFRIRLPLARQSEKATRE